MENNNTQVISDYQMESEPHPEATFLYLIIRIFVKLCLLAFIGFAGLIALYCQRRRALSDPTPVVVTSATHTAPGGYPVTQLPPPGYPASNAYAMPAAYPAQTTGNVTVQMPMPMPQQHQHMPMPMPGMQTHGVSYPPYPGAGPANMNPPSYDIAMANPGPSVMPAGYEKQAPYNPNFGQ